MSLRDITQAAIDKNPLNLKTAVEAELGQRVYDAIQAKMSNAFAEQEEFDEDIFEEEFEQIDELDKKTLGSYVKKASNDAAAKVGNAMQKSAQGDHKGFGKDFVKARSRQKGIEKAVDKMVKKESIELGEEMDEGACVREMKKLYAAACPKMEMYKKCNEKYGCSKSKFEALYAQYCKG